MKCQLLKTEAKQEFRSVHSDDALFRMFKTVFKPFETRMTELHVSPEEVMLCSFGCFDELRRMEAERRDAFADELYDEVLCSMREEAEECCRNCSDADLHTATCAVLCGLVILLNASEQYELARLNMFVVNSVTEKGDELFGLFNEGYYKAMDNDHDADYVAAVRQIVADGIFPSDTDQTKKVRKVQSRPLVKKQDKRDAYKAAERQLAFMKGIYEKKDVKIMADGDFTAMMEAVSYIIENNSLKILPHKIRTSLPNSHLRYAFYNVFREVKFVDRSMWIEFLKNTFSQFDGISAESLTKHFSDKP